MSTLYTNTSGSRLAVLVSTQRTLFHMHDLALLWNCSNPNTLRITLQRAVQQGWLYHVQRGLYSVQPPEKLPQKALGSACLHRYSYISTETVLRDAGYIQQTITPVTFVSSVSRKWELFGSHYICRQLSPRFLQNTTGIVQHNDYRSALPERAIADMLYFDPWYHFDTPIDWTAIRTLQEAIGYPLTPHRYAHSPKA